MKSKFGRRGTQASRVFAFALLASALLIAPATAEEPLSIVLDQATILKMPEKVSTIVVGNPVIADISVQSGGLVVVTGKGYGSTNFIVLDRAGTVLMERQVVVRGPADQVVQVYKGVERETFSCTPNCQRRITLGDSAGFFSQTMTQTEIRANQASAAGTRGQGRQ
jgi:Flp pilus assembly secretin CpaC